MKLTLAALCAALVLAACQSTTDIDTSGMERIPDFGTLDYTRIQPQAYDYWELRFSWGGGQPRDSVLGSGGARTRAQIDTATLRVFDATRPPSGFAQGCLPAFCYMYIAAVSGSSVTIINSNEALRTFLAPIDTREEAMLLLRARSFYWHPDDGGVTGVARNGNGWEFVVLELVRDCAPVQTDRVHVIVRENGSINEREREVYERSQNACV